MANQVFDNCRLHIQIKCTKDEHKGLVLQSKSKLKDVAFLMFKVTIAGEIVRRR